MQTIIRCYKSIEKATTVQSRAREQKYFTIERRNLESQVPNRNKGRETDK
jgi:hypothetical protein